ncbi:MAG TPA: hypothetical protein VGC26_02560 [Afipia sp.]
MNNIIIVMAGLVPAIHVFIISTFAKDVDARHKAGHDDKFEMLTS